MRLQVMSDLHLQFQRQYSPAGSRWFEDEFPAQTQTDADTLVLAGDVVDLHSPQACRQAHDWLMSFAVRYKRIIFCPGNHEFYGTSIEAGTQELLRIAETIPNLHLLTPGMPLVLDDQRFLGGTMWYPKPPKGTPAISDHRFISDRAPRAYQEHERLKHALLKSLGPDDIVITHHTPSEQSIPEQFKDSAHNHWFCVPEMETIIRERQPKMWIHGHTHTHFDYWIGNTRVLCNPFGYPGELDVGFEPKLVVEV